jgi:hypothetical protein
MAAGAGGSRLIGTYNMSYASDMPKKDIDTYKAASEHTFLSSIPEGQDKRSFWNNATKFVEQFINEPNFGAIGLQEMNLTEDGLTGTSFIKKNIIKETPHIASIAQEIIAGTVKTSLMILWNKDVMGEQEGPAYKADLDFFHKELPATIKNGIQTWPRNTGRPIVMVKTANGYLLINLHGPNFAEASRRTMSDLKAAIQEHVNKFIGTFIGDKSIHKGKVFIMGDFNDRYDSIKTIDLQTGDIKHTLTYQGKAPKSCCHNWDSSCSDDRFRKVETFSEREGRESIGTCDVPEFPNGSKYPLAGAPEIVRIPMGEEGHLKNYRYTGDKVFGDNPAGDIHIYKLKSDTNESPRIVSQESDHEPVAAAFSLSMAGGKRRSRRSKKTYRKKRVMKRRITRRRR